MVSVIPWDATRTSIPESYKIWNEALIAEFLIPGGSSPTVFLNVQDIILDELSSSLGFGHNGRAAFVHSVASVAGRHKDVIFSRLFEIASSWRNSSRTESPPFVAGLGLTVLAASDMRFDGGVGAVNYYRRLNDLLDRPEDARQPEGFEKTEILWEWLADWLFETGRGEIPATPKGAPRYVGAAIKHCLVRAADVSEYWSAIKTIEPGLDETSDPSEVAGVMTLWLRGPGAESRLARMLGPAPSATAIEDASSALLAGIGRFEKEVPYEASGRTNSLRLSLRLHPLLGWKRVEWCTAFRTGSSDDRLEAEIWVGNTPVQARLDQREPPRYLAVLPLDLGADLVRGSVEATISGLACRLPRSTLLFESGVYSGREGTWELARSVVSGRPYALVVSAGELDLTNALLAKISAVSEATGVQGDSSRWPGPGFAAIWGIRFHEGTSLPGLPIASSRVPIRIVDAPAVRPGVFLRGLVGSLAVLGDAVVKILKRPAMDEVATISGGHLRALDLDEGRYEATYQGGRALFSVLEPRWGELRSLPSFEQEMHSGIASSDFRGAVWYSEPADVYHFEPGCRYSVLLSRVEKISVPFDAGITEQRFTAPVMGITKTHVPPLKPKPLLAHPAIHSVPPYESIPQEKQDGEGVASVTGDRLLYYMSARGAGPLQSVQSIAMAIAGEDRSWTAPMRLLEHLGHVDIDWARRRWAIAPSTICRTASNPTIAFVAGRRTPDLVDVISRWASSRSPASIEVQEQQWIGFAPRPLILRETQPGGCEELACSIGGLQLVDTPAEAWAAQCSEIFETSSWTGRQISPPEHSLRMIEEWNVEDGRWRPIKLSPLELQRNGLPKETLMRWPDGGRTWNFIAIDGKGMMVIDPSACKWWLADDEFSLFKYDFRSATLAIPSFIGLPRWLYRAATLASGLPPRRFGRALVFGSISQRLARLLAVRLGQSYSEGLW